MTVTATVITVGFVFVAMLTSFWLRLKLERDLLIGTIRATIQLIAVGYVLEFVFSSHSSIFIVLMLFIMVFVASRNSAQRGKGVPNIFWRIFITNSCVTAFTLGLMLILHLVKAEPQAIIPIGGMIIGSSMVVCSLLLNQMKQRTESMEQEILVALSLGATAKQASERMNIESIRAGMIPTIDSLKTVGLVQLPGMMTGLIIGGVSPVTAVRYQLLIMFSFTAAGALTSIMLGFLVYPTLFTRAHQFIGWPQK
ncbi:iron export ABC transporter permease subunit FetB [Aneurinibacillus sp. Ricciae_BoGa-3]|uniref:ABC transporter permease n=1 Tax=Aneurinibacillus sp. Ricciae_BoGa-3 TaxID=3022697 RepID=UPI002341E223|nr:iron export ABC transporter permease subunit FetB [Aneurinibacillus sp. Ricciae_BoGa-3]WCK53375.1 iron export ABC transporter permease subunit FetB [Aneurinibacillus sp. Ricciae_BoGa-3]